MLSDLVKQVNFNSQLQNNFRDTFQGQLPFPPPLPPIGRPEPLTVPDFPHPFYSNTNQPPLLPPPVNILQLVSYRTFCPLFWSPIGYWTKSLVTER